jgi:carbon storage regulator CsrA
LLVTRRRAGESIRIDDRIDITVIEITPARVLLGIEAPHEVRIERSETMLIATENLAAATPPARIEAAFARRAAAPGTAIPSGDCGAERTGPPSAETA